MAIIRSKRPSDWIEKNPCRSHYYDMTTGNDCDPPPNLKPKAELGHVEAFKRNLLNNTPQHIKDKMEAKDKEKVVVAETRPVLSVPQTKAVIMPICDSKPEDLSTVIKPNEASLAKEELPMKDTLTGVAQMEIMEEERPMSSMAQMNKLYVESVVIEETPEAEGVLSVPPATKKQKKEKAPTAPKKEKKEKLPDEGLYSVRNDEATPKKVFVSYSKNLYNRITSIKHDTKGKSGIKMKVHPKLSPTEAILHYINSGYDIVLSVRDL